MADIVQFPLNQLDLDAYNLTTDEKDRIVLALQGRAMKNPTQESIDTLRATITAIIADYGSYSFGAVEISTLNVKFKALRTSLTNFELHTDIVSGVLTNYTGFPPNFLGRLSIASSYNKTKEALRKTLDGPCKVEENKSEIFSAVFRSIIGHGQTEIESINAALIGVENDTNSFLVFKSILTAAVTAVDDFKTQDNAAFFRAYNFVNRIALAQALISSKSDDFTTHLFENVVGTRIFNTEDISALKIQCQVWGDDTSTPPSDFTSNFGDEFVLSSVGDLIDIVLDGITIGDVLQFNTNALEAVSLASLGLCLDDLCNVSGATSASNGQALLYNSTSEVYEPGTVSGGGGSTFIALTDTPGSITANDFVRGNAGGTDLEFGTIGISDLPGITAGMIIGLATVAESGSYADLSGTPTNVSDFVNDTGFITGNETITLSGDVTGSGATAITTTVVEGAVTQHEAAIDHDALTNFVANEHIDHSSVTFTAGTGLSGGGTLESNRTFTVDLNELTTETTIAGGDFIAMVDITDSGSGKITFTNFESTLSLTKSQISDFSHVHATSDLTSGTLNTIRGGTGVGTTPFGLVNFAFGGNYSACISNIDGFLDTVLTDISAFDTDDLAEGSNLYYTDERVDDRVGALVVGGNNLTATYNDGAGTLTLDVDTLTEADISDLGTYYKAGDVMLASFGTELLPGFAFDTDPDTGIYRSGVDKMGFVVKGSEVFYIEKLSGIFDLMAIDCHVFSIAASVSWACSAPDIRFFSDNTSNPGLVKIFQGTAVGTDYIGLTVESALAATVTWQLPSVAVADGVWKSDGSGVITCEKVDLNEITVDDTIEENEGVLVNASGVVVPNIWANAICLSAEEGANLNTTTNSGFQYSLGNGDVGDGFGHIIPFDYELIAIGLSSFSNSAGTVTVEVWVGADADTSSSASGVDVSLASSERHNFTIAGSPVSGDAGDWLTFKTTANAGGAVNGGRVTAWVRPR